MNIETKQKRHRPSNLARRIKRLLFRVVLLAVVLAGLGAGILWAKNLILTRQVQMITAQAGTLQVPIPIQAWAANTEQVISAPSAGTLDKLVPQGQRVAKGGVVAKLVSQVMNNQSGGVIHTFTSPVAGLVSYQIDGLEGLLTPANLTQWDLVKFNQLNPTNRTSGNLTSGQAACKIVDNLSPTYLLFQSPEPERSLARDDRVTLLIGDSTVKGTVVKTAVSGPQDGVVVVLDSFLTHSLTQRRLSLDLLNNKPATGEIIPVAALVLQQGLKGVYLVKDGVSSWQQVQVLAQDKEKVCVTGLKTGDTVVTTPELVHQGEIIDGNL